MVINSQETLTHPLLLLLPFLFLLFTVYCRRKPAVNLPPGPPPYPMFGNLHNLDRRKPPHHLLPSLQKIWPPHPHQPRPNPHHVRL
ncbi:hypothetical protein KFK09_029345 [Dendrobium nobile]|uniref:Cytochrome P450 n=1 Tax=Dendrobium nobile TaxID=94219 RepID=A0A8T3A0J4_DENNO|nr:hypothetical protein KFK09_029345 [Dendrobium nobile]